MKYENLKSKISELKEDDLIASLKLAGRIICIGEEMKRVRKAIDEALSHDQVKSLELLEVKLKQHGKEIYDIRKFVEETIVDPALTIDILDELLEEVSNA
jgi:phosphoenolpyruvate carboxylase